MNLNFTFKMLGWLLLSGCAPIHVLPTVDTAAQLPAIVVHGVRLHAQTFGDASHPTVIVVHGGPGGDYRSLESLSALADQYFVVFYDQRGSGQSQRVPDSELTVDAFVDELDGVVDHFAHGQRVRLVGHSWGAMLAAAYLGRHPEKVEQAVLAEPGMLNDEAAKRLLEATNGLRPPMTLGTLTLATGLWFRSLGVTGPDPDARADWFSAALMQSDLEGHPMAGYFCGHSLAQGHLEGWRFGARANEQLFSKARRADGSWSVDFVHGLDQFPRRVLLLAGSCDVVIGEAQQRLHAALFPSAEVVVIAGAGHTMFAEKPDDSLAIVRRYFSAP